MNDSEYREATEHMSMDSNFSLPEHEWLAFEKHTRAARNVIQDKFELDSY